MVDFFNSSTCCLRSKISSLRLPASSSLRAASALSSTLSALSLAASSMAVARALCRLWWGLSVDAGLSLKGSTSSIIFFGTLHSGRHSTCWEPSSAPAFAVFFFVVVACRYGMVWYGMVLSLPLPRARACSLPIFLPFFHCFCFFRFPGFSLFPFTFFVFPFPFFFRPAKYSRRSPCASCCTTFRARA